MANGGADTHTPLAIHPHCTSSNHSVLSLSGSPVELREGMIVRRGYTLSRFKGLFQEFGVLVAFQASVWREGLSS